MADTSKYKVGIVLSVENKTSSGKKPLKVCVINVGGAESITVVTSATNVREGSRIVVAPVGSTVLNNEGEEITLKKSPVGGIPSEGMFCDAAMLGWGSGAAGIAAQVPDSCEPGTAPPPTKPGAPPRADAGSTESVPATEVKGLFEKKLTKEEKKKIAEERRKAKKAAKEAKKREEENSGQ